MGGIDDGDPAPGPVELGAELSPGQLRDHRAEGGTIGRLDQHFGTVELQAQPVPVTGKSTTAMLARGGIHRKIEVGVDGEMPHPLRRPGTCRVNQRARAVEAGCPMPRPGHTLWAPRTICRG